MKHKGLYFMVALALGGVGAVHAQDNAAATTGSSDSTAAPAWPNGFDDRWYIAPTIGGYYNDTDRNTNSRQIYYGLAVGKFFTPDLSLDLFADRTKRDIDHHAGTWASNNVGVAVRYYFGSNAWRPYLLAGVMGSHHKNPVDSDWAPAAELGLGLSKAVTDSSDIRVEGGYRYDWDDKSQTTKSGYGFVIKTLKRGQAVDQAVEVFRGQAADVSARPNVLHDAAGATVVLLTRATDFFHDETYLWDGKAAKRLPIPEKVGVRGLPETRFAGMPPVGKTP